MGETQEYRDKALDIIGNLGRKQISIPIKGKDHEICDKLLQRDWFHRIWVRLFCDLESESTDNLS